MVITGARVQTKDRSIRYRLILENTGADGMTITAITLDLGGTPTIRLGPYNRFRLDSIRGWQLSPGENWSFDLDYPQRPKGTPAIRLDLERFKVSREEPIVEDVGICPCVEDETCIDEYGKCCFDCDNGRSHRCGCTYPKPGISYTIDELDGEEPTGRTQTVTECVQCGGELERSIPVH